MVMMQMQQDTDKNIDGSYKLFKQLYVRFTLAIAQGTV
uniref:Uncharacterized protein n=1 Tax=Arundo donax TaxID=35708 RepID=A0A0A9FQI6_ARUDO